MMGDKAIAAANIEHFRSSRNDARDLDRHVVRPANFPAALLAFQAPPHSAESTVSLRLISRSGGITLNAFPSHQRNKRQRHRSPFEQTKCRRRRTKFAR
jgi:hypothetical protein